MSHRVVKSSIVAVLAVGAAAVLVAGPLDPPSGPVTGTYKTLSEVEPRIAINATNTPGDADSLFKITLRGSYYLTGNITGVAAKHGVEIAAGGVTLDLNGFDLLGVAGSLDGVSATVVNLPNIAVVNGSVRNWGDEGVDLGTFITINCRVADLLASGNAGNGISTSNGGTVTNCSAYLNAGNGISGSSGCTITNCSAYLNAGSGISTVNGCTVADCTARGNTLDGIVCSTSCVIRGNTCSSNGNVGDGAGIHATSSDNRIEGNTCTLADRGIDVDLAGSIIIKNTCSGNTIDWVIAANNVFGPIIDRRAPGSPLVSGFTAASSLGSTDANANFSY